MIAFREFWVLSYDFTQKIAVTRAKMAISEEKEGFPKIPGQCKVSFSLCPPGMPFSAAEGNRGEKKKKSRQPLKGFHLKKKKKSRQPLKGQ